VKLNSIPAIGDYIELTSLTELKLQRQHVFTLKVVNICHAIMEFKAPSRDETEPAHSVSIYCETMNQ
ncbi:MAG: hypothetical protein ACRCVE_10425, partial [Plesiomonas sp.]